ncbi:MAG: ATP-dependent helicase [Phycisphaera sp.]|nr:ATP-dependent helicase [Phycisphaera sp.]
MTSRAHWSEGLNAAQHEAVSYDSGPVAVLAGPGTGKTRVITHRIARLIDEGGSRPESIAAVTFTVKAATEMRERLGALIGDSPASQVSVGTFHSLGRRILNRWGDTIGVPGRAELMDSVQRKRMLREACRLAIDEGKIPGALLADGGVEALGLRAWAWIEFLRTSAVFADESMKLAERWMEWINEQEGSEGWDEERVAAERTKAEELTASSAVYTHFERIRLERGLLGFDDYIMLPIRVLRESERARAVILDELRHMVVDEFQDVNGAQLAFLRELSPPKMQRDICVVGDDDQAIYGFRGSDDRAFQHFAEIWKGAEVVTLTENYRSSEAVLTTAQRVINAAHDRFEPEKEIHARRDFEDAPEQVEAVHVAGPAEEGVTIAAMILKDLAEHEGRDLSRIAVIGRSHTTVSEIGRALELEGIPVDFSQTRRYEEDEAVLDIKAWIGLVTGAPGPNIMRLLVRPPVALSPEVAVGLISAYAAHERQAKVENQEAMSVGAFLTERAEEHAGLARLAELLAEFTGEAAVRSAEEMVRVMIERTGVAHRELPSPREEARRVRALATFIGFVRTLQPRIDAPGDLASFQRYYEELDADEQARGLASFEGKESEDDTEFAAEGVKLLTAHASKGLEFDTVYVPRIGAAAGCFGQVMKREGPSLPAELGAFEADERSAHEREQDEVRRLFYVACTRAERRLVLLSKRAKDLSKSMHLFQELAWRGKTPLGPDERGESVVLVEGEDVVARAGESGVVLRGGDALSAEGGAAGSEREIRSRVIADARRTARRAAASALDRAEDGLADEDELDAIGDELGQSARRLAIVRAVEAGLDVPTWLAGADGYADELAQQIEGAIELVGRGTGLRKLTAPLELSYSKIDQYQRCPGCFYLRYVLGMVEPGTSQQIVGTVAHAALERFYRRWSDADAEGLDKPGLDDLLVIARELFVMESRRVRGVEASQLDQIEAQLRLGYERLHDDGAEVMMLEENAPFAYEREGVDERAHTFKAKLDRVDRLAEGFRIVDYKTGQAWGRLREPKKDDLQLGIYAMALAARLEMPIEELAGSAEYWLFATGERGVIGLGEIDHKKVRKAIDRAIEGMLAGEFAPKKDCGEQCRLLLGGGGHG